MQSVSACRAKGHYGTIWVYSTILGLVWCVATTITSILKSLLKFFTKIFSVSSQIFFTRRPRRNCKNLLLDCDLCRPPLFRLFPCPPPFVFCLPLWSDLFWGLFLVPTLSFPAPPPLLADSYVRASGGGAASNWCTWKTCPCFDWRLSVDVFVLFLSLFVTNSFNGWTKRLWSSIMSVSDSIWSWHSSSLWIM